MQLVVMLKVSREECKISETGYAYDLKVLPAIGLASVYVVLCLGGARSRRSGWVVKDEVGAETGRVAGAQPHRGPRRAGRHDRLSESRV